MQSITIVSCFHGRPLIAQMFCEQILRLQKSGYNVKAVVAVSDMEGARLCVQYGFDFVPIQNTPVGNKWNAAVDHACKVSEGYIIILGDDDFIGDDYFEAIQPYIDRGERYFGLSSLCFSDAQNKKAIEFEYFRSRLVGAGRVIHSDVLRQYGYFVKMQYHKTIESRSLKCKQGETKWIPKDIALYQNGVGFGVIASEPQMRAFAPKLNSGLDNSFELYFVSRGVMPVQIKTKVPVLTDIKSGSNMWSFEHISKDKNVKVMIDYDFSIRMLSDVEKHYLHLQIE